jgi:predicted transcriptional regulator
VSGQKLSRSLVRKVESDQETPLTKLEAVRELREHLDLIEELAMLRARKSGASISEIAETMGMTRQTVYNKLKHISEKHETIIVPELVHRPEK